DAPPPHLLERPLGERRADAAALSGRVDRDHVDLAAPSHLVEDDVDEARDAAVEIGHPGLVVGERLANRRRLIVTPIRMDAAVEVPAHQGFERCEHRYPRLKRELDDLLLVWGGEGSDGGATHGSI